MGQTLTHGVYLPDEGERNCYSGLAGNWTILDNSVGTIAEHTTQIAGKANAVHTHTKSDITDFPAYGNAAGTICEGNDSRLSDARTPVAHTHGKADITDLFNSANTWTAYNTFTGDARPIRLRGSNNDIYNVQPQSPIYSQIDFVDKNNATMSYILFQHRTDATETHRLCLRQKRITLDAYYSVDLNNLGDFYPEQSNAINLGTSNNKWKSLNGINPGALSFPEGTTSNANTTFNPDLTDWLTDGTGFTITAQVTGWLHIRIQNSTGNFAWVKRASAGSNQTWGIVGNSDTNSDIADMPLNVPVVQGYVYTLKLKTPRLSAAIFMCLGNV